MAVSVTVNPDVSFSYISALGFTGHRQLHLHVYRRRRSKSDVATVGCRPADRMVYRQQRGRQRQSRHPGRSLHFDRGVQRGAGHAGRAAGGHTVYLRAGTGTYAEADGINLLNDQILTGAQDRGRHGEPASSGRLSSPPTPAITASSSPRTIRSRASTSATRRAPTFPTATARWATSPSSTSASSGAGQIVDIDQGGTLNVTLNSAASTLSPAARSTSAASAAASPSPARRRSSASTAAAASTSPNSSGLNVTFAGSFVSSTGLFDGMVFSGNIGSSLNLTGGLKDIDGTGAAADGILFTNNTGGSALEQTGGGSRHRRRQRYRPFGPDRRRHDLHQRRRQQRQQRRRQLR